MDLKTALKEQYHASLTMLAECVEKCPDDLWLQGEYPRYYWRIVMHTVFFTQVYMPQDFDSYQPWPGRPTEKHENMWQDPAYVEPYELPEGAEPFSREEALEYIRFVDGTVDSTVDGLDLEREDSGFSWYPNTSKLSHELMNVRHIQGHVGQLSELLMVRGIDIEWIADAHDVRERLENSQKH